MSELRRRLMMRQVGGGGGGLPSEYQQVEYIEKNGANYIDIPFVISEKVEIKVRVFCPFMGWNRTNIFGSSAYIQCSMSKYFDSIGMNYGYAQPLSKDYAFYPTPRDGDVGNFWLVMTANMLTNYSSVYREDTQELIESSCKPGSFPKKSPLVVFDNTAVAPLMKISSIEITDVLKLIPCYRKSDNVAGMYDIVNGVFYTNNGSGSFIVGPDVN